MPATFACNRDCDAVVLLSLVLCRNTIRIQTMIYICYNSQFPVLGTAMSRELASKPATPIEVESSSDSEEFGDDVPTPRMVENFTKSPSPGLLVGHAYVLLCLNRFNLTDTIHESS